MRYGIFRLLSALLCSGKVQEYFISDLTTTEYTPGPSCKRPWQTASCDACRPTSTACSSSPLLGLPRFRRHKGGENDGHVRLLHEIGRYFRHTFPHNNGVIIRFISNLYKDDVILPENRFWWIYGLRADLLKSPQKLGQYIKGLGVNWKGDSCFHGSPNILSMAVNISTAFLRHCSAVRVLMN